MRVGILIKPGISEGKNLSARVKSWLKVRGVEVVPGEKAAGGRVKIASDLDLLIVLGGDGTLLYAASILGQSRVPVLGVNLGGLGFLTEVKKSELFPLLNRFLAGKVQPEERMMLEAKALSGGRKRTFYSLNEFTVSSGSVSRMVDLETRVDGMHLTSFRADGLIVSTPTGSTAYCMAAGGPIVHPDMKCLILTPICAHTLTSRPLVVPGTSEVEVRLSSRGAEAYLTADGRISMRLKDRQRLTIRAAEKPFSLISSPGMDYYSILHTKLHWGGDR